MSSNVERTAPSPREQLENLMNEAFGERTPRKLFRFCAAEFDLNGGGSNPQFFEEFFYLSDEEAVEVCRGLVSSLKPYASRRADKEGRPKNSALPKPANQNGNPNQTRGNKREQPSEEKELALA
ncbi:MAG TPA: hypothetical protein VNT79_18740 [Phycisphaerae bacterium]|nr:hypothetical protein [Phycisphaerae bacterium]